MQLCCCWSTHAGTSWPASDCMIRDLPFGTDCPPAGFCACSMQCSVTHESNSVNSSQRQPASPASTLRALLPQCGDADREIDVALECLLAAITSSAAYEQLLIREVPMFNGSGKHVPHTKESPTDNAGSLPCCAEAFYTYKASAGYCMYGARAVFMKCCNKKRMK